jgi:hypothetical protein
VTMAALPAVSVIKKTRRELFMECSFGGAGQFTQKTSHRRPAVAA